MVDFISTFSEMSSLETLDIKNFNTSSAKMMSFFFSELYSLNQLNLSNFDTSKVEDMRFMFRSNTAIELLDLRSFNLMDGVIIDELVYLILNSNNVTVIVNSTNKQNLIFKEI